MQLCFFFFPLFHKLLVFTFLGFVVLEGQNSVHWVPVSLIGFSQFWKERMKMGDVQRKSRELFVEVWVFLHSELFLCHLQLHREEINPGSVYGTQCIRAGTAPSLPSREKCTMQVKTCTQPSPNILGLWKTQQKRHFCLCREWLHRGAEQWSCLGLMNRKWARAVPLCGCSLSIPTLMGAHSVATNGVVFQTPLFTFKMMKLSSHSY